MIVIGDLHSILLINELQGTIRHSCVILDKDHGYVGRSEEHTSELQSRETISYAVFCLKKKKK